MTASLDKKQLLRQIKQLRRDIVHHVRDGEPSLPTSLLVATIRTELGQIQDRIGKYRDRMSQLDAKKELYESLDKACEKTLKELAGAVAQLEDIARPLGHVVFLAYRAGEVDNRPCFADRIALQQKIEVLQAAHSQLSPPSDASFFQKTKAKAQQMAVAGKIKYEELKVGSQETRIGKSLLDSGAEQAVASATTTALLDKVCRQRAAIAKLRSESEAARSALDSKTRDFCRVLGLSGIEDKRTFDAEIRECQNRIGQAQREMTALEDGIPDRLAADTGEMGTPLASLLGALRHANERMTLLRQKKGSRTTMVPPQPATVNLPAAAKAPPSGLAQNPSPQTQPATPPDLQASPSTPVQPHTWTPTTPPDEDTDKDEGRPNSWTPTTPPADPPTPPQSKNWLWITIACVILALTNPPEEKHKQIVLDRLSHHAAKQGVWSMLSLAAGKDVVLAQFKYHSYLLFSTTTYKYPDPGLEVQTTIGVLGNVFILGD